MKIKKIYSNNLKFKTKLNSNDGKSICGVMLCCGSSNEETKNRFIRI